MSYEVHFDEGFTIAGVSARVDPAEPQTIGEVWGRFYGAGGVRSVPGRLYDVVYSVYCEYERDYTKPYTVVIGCAVDPLAATAQGLTVVDVLPGKFAVYKAEGEVPQAVLDAWSAVWATPLDRSYKADFDRYGTDGVVTIHVGLRED